MVTVFGDYSHICEVKHIDYLQSRDAHSVPGIWCLKKFVSALEKVGEQVFKIRTSRLPLSHRDISDDWMDLRRCGWSVGLAIDESMDGFNEVYIFEKINSEQ